MAAPALPGWSLKQWAAFAAALLLVLAGVSAMVWREDIHRTLLDPKVPYQTYDPPPAPDYARPEAWALIPQNPTRWSAADGPADVFFVHPTTYDGGKHWNAPLDDRGVERGLRAVMLPNYAGPFERVGRLFAPRYRQASLYAWLRLREDAREARAFAYADVRDAFRRYVADYNRGRPFVLTGVGQGGFLAERLVREEIAPYPELRARFAAAYLIDAFAPADRYAPGAPVPACREPRQPRCVAAWVQVVSGDEEAGRRRLENALVWTEAGDLADPGDRTPLCFNPLLGMTGEADAPARLNKGAANATDLERGARPAFLSRQVGARCVDGVLQVSRPRSGSLRPEGSWSDRRKAPGYNLFYADIEADAEARVAALLGLNDFPVPAAPIDRSIEVKSAPIRSVR